MHAPGMEFSADQGLIKHGNIFKGVFKKLYSDYKSPIDSFVPTTINSAATTEINWAHLGSSQGQHVVDLQKSFVDKDLLIDSLKDGVTLDSLAKKDEIKEVDENEEHEDQQRFTFMKSKSSLLGNIAKRRMTREEYVNYSTSQRENYIADRLKNREKDSQSEIGVMSIKEKSKNSKTSRTPNLYSKSSNRPSQNVSIVEESIKGSLFASTPKFSTKSRVTGKSRNNYAYDSVLTRISQNRIIQNKNDSIKLLTDSMEHRTKSVIGKEVLIDRSFSKLVMSIRNKHNASQSPLYQSRCSGALGVEETSKNTNHSFLPFLYSKIPRDIVMKNPILNICQESSGSRNAAFIQSYRKMNRNKCYGNRITENVRVRYAAAMNNKSVDRIAFKNRYFA
jgi:hypothetical protein